MQELKTRLIEKAGISADQATKAIDTIKDFVKEKFPMMAGAVDNLLGSEASPSTSSYAANSNSSNIMDKISDFIPGETGQKVEEYAKKAAEKAEGIFNDVKKELKDL